MGRPREINRFAAIAVGASMVNAFGTVSAAQFTTRALIAAPLGILIVAGLVGWIIQGRSRIGRLVLTVWLAFGLGATLASFLFLLVRHQTGLMSPVVQVVTLLTVIANCFALFFLWSHAATAWLQESAEMPGQP
jgi:hypothetical protein